MMARTHGRIFSSIWTDADFLALDGESQRLYLFMLSQSDLSHAGLLPLRARRWAKKCAGGTVAALEKSLAALSETRFIVADEDTEEVLIRSFVRNDGVWRQPKVMMRMREDARQIESPALRAAFAEELHRIPLGELKAERTGPRGDQPSTREVVSEIVSDLLADFEEDTHSEGYREGYGVPPAYAHARSTSHLPPTTSHQPPATAPEQGHLVVGNVSSEIAAAIPRPDERQDVESILDYLDAAIASNGARVPKRTKRNRDAVRLMLDSDGYTVDQVRAAIEFATGDEFWRANILSASKLREKYEQLRLQARRNNWRRPGDRHERHQQFWEAEHALAHRIDGQPATDDARALEA